MSYQHTLWMAAQDAIREGRNDDAQFYLARWEHDRYISHSSVNPNTQSRSTLESAERAWARKGGE